MTNTQASDKQGTKRQTQAALRLEVVVIPVENYDRAKDFYTAVEWRSDGELNLDGGYRLTQFTPPGSSASILFGTQITSARAGSFDGLILAVDDITAARDDLISRGSTSATFSMTPTAR